MLHLGFLRSCKQAARERAPENQEAVGSLALEPNHEISTIALSTSRKPEGTHGDHVSLHTLVYTHPFSSHYIFIVAASISSPCFLLAFPPARQPSFYLSTTFSCIYHAFTSAISQRILSCILSSLTLRWIRVSQILV